jgi:peptidoglycan/LPS O-acetylase OafA/YrhL
LETIPQTPVSWITSRLKKPALRSSKKSKGTITALDGVRAVAALSVVSLHLNKGAGVPWNINREPLLSALAVFGRTGVVLFFVLSGFLLFRPYAKALLFQERWPSMRTFYIRRIFRIWPGYYITLILIILLFQRQYLQPAHWKELALFLTFFMDSSSKTWQQLNGPFWTLAIEWQFYMVLPFIALGFWWVGKRFSSVSPQQRLLVVLACCGSVIIWGLALRYLGNYCLSHPNWTFLVPRSVLNVFLFFTFGIQGKYLEVFALGMIVSTCYVYAQHPEFGVAFKARLERLSYWIWGGGILVLFFMSMWQAEATRPMNGVLSILNAFSFFDPYHFQYAWLGDPITAFGYSACVLAILFGSSTLRWFFETRLLGWIGMISFSLYMWHLQFLTIYQATLLLYVPHSSALIINLSYWVWIVVVVIPFCYLFYIIIEKTGMRIGELLTSKKPEGAQSFSAKVKAIFS